MERLRCPVCYDLGGGGLLHHYLEIENHRKILMCDECNSAWYQESEVALATEESNLIFGENFERGPTRLAFNDYFLYLEANKAEY